MRIACAPTPRTKVIVYLYASAAYRLRRGLMTNEAASCSCQNVARSFHNKPSLTSNTKHAELRRRGQGLQAGNRHSGMCSLSFCHSTVTCASCGLLYDGSHHPLTSRPATAAIALLYTGRDKYSLPSTPL